MLGDVYVRYVGTAVDTNGSYVGKPRREVQSLIRDEDRFELQSIGCTVADVLHFSRRCVRIYPEFHS
ncbi:MAG: hypothetical protein ABJB34_13110 [Acidobacteriota bacterium]